MSSKLNNIKAISFDAAGTLFHAAPSVGHHYAEIAGQFGLSVDPYVIETRFRNVFQARGGLASLGDRSSEAAERRWWRETVELVFKGFGFPERFEEFFEALYRRFGSHEAWELYPEVNSVLGRLKKSAFRLAVISNWDSRLLKLLDEFKLSPYFSRILFSAQVGATKPHRQIFDRLAEELDLRSDEILHVGDNFLCDVEGALAADFKAVYLDRKNVTHDGENCCPVINNLSELIDLL